MIEIEVRDQAEHRRRVEERRSDLDGLTVPSWEQVLTREYSPGTRVEMGPRLNVCDDGAPETSLALIRAYLDQERVD